MLTAGDERDRPRATPREAGTVGLDELPDDLARRRIAATDVANERV